MELGFAVRASEAGDAPADRGACATFAVAPGAAVLVDVCARVFGCKDICGSTPPCDRVDGDPRDGERMPTMLPLSPTERSCVALCCCRRAMCAVVSGVGRSRCISSPSVAPCATSRISPLAPQRCNCSTGARDARPSPTAAGECDRDGERAPSVSNAESVERARARRPVSLRRVEVSGVEPRSDIGRASIAERVFMAPPLRGRRLSERPQARGTMRPASAEHVLNVCSRARPLKPREKSGPCANHAQRRVPPRDRLRSRLHFFRPSHLRSLTLRP